jgi:hypothetical protein
MKLIAPDASPEEAAAVAAALERFMRDTAPTPVPPPATRDPWILAAMLEGVGRDDEALKVRGPHPPDPHNPDPHPWA